MNQFSINMSVFGKYLSLILILLEVKKITKKQFENCNMHIVLLKFRLK